MGHKQRVVKLVPKTVDAVTSAASPFEGGTTAVTVNTLKRRESALHAATNWPAKRSALEIHVTGSGTCFAAERFSCIRWQLIQ
jgi:hypothetical protein